MVGCLRFVSRPSEHWISITDGSHCGDASRGRKRTTPHRHVRSFLHAARLTASNTDIIRHRICRGRARCGRAPRAGDLELPRPAQDPAPVRLRPRMCSPMATGSATGLPSAAAVGRYAVARPRRNGRRRKTPRGDERKRRAIRYARHRRFDLRKLIALPAPEAIRGQGAPAEVDLEGIAFADGCLWVAGSHSAVRDSPNGGSTVRRNRRARQRPALRQPLPARANSGSSRAPMGRPSCADVGRPSGRVLRAARLPGGRKNDALTRLLCATIRISVRFLSIPSKDNGFDIEGLAAAPGGRLFLGLRGPVIDGWACVLEIVVGAHPDRDDELVLRQAAGTDPRRRARSARYRKHFLDLEGAGIRDLCLAGRDLLILTGPPMRGKGKAQVRRWRNALAVKQREHAGRRRSCRSCWSFRIGRRRITRKASRSSGSAATASADGDLRLRGQGSAPRRPRRCGRRCTRSTLPPLEARKAVKRMSAATRRRGGWRAPAPGARTP